jgi:hypothetical protein
MSVCLSVFPGYDRLEEVEGGGLPELDVGNLGELPPHAGEEAFQVAEAVRGRQQVLDHLRQGQHLQTRIFKIVSTCKRGYLKYSATANDDI